MCDTIISWKDNQEKLSKKIPWSDYEKKVEKHWMNYQKSFSKAQR